MRDGDAYSNSFAHGYAHTDGDANSYKRGYGDANSDADADANSDRFGIGNPYVSAWGHTWAVEHCCTRAERSISRWWNDRWNLLLRLRWPNLHRRLPK
jgi:hypothetical protein